jgi:hypothetical protein
MALCPRSTLDRRRREQRDEDQGSDKVVIGPFRAPTSRERARRMALKNPPNSGPTWPIFVTAVGFVLFISCTNLAGVLIARLTRRRREFAVRAAMGARASRITRRFGRLSWRKTSNGAHFWTPSDGAGPFRNGGAGN